MFVYQIELYKELKICPNIVKLYGYVCKKKYTKSTLTKINQILQKITDDEIMLDKKKAAHPFLHELAHQCFVSFEMFKEVWRSPIFHKYWLNSDYLDECGKNVYQRLVETISSGGSDPKILKWFEVNMDITPIK